MPGVRRTGPRPRLAAPGGPRSPNTLRRGQGWRGRARRLHDPLRRPRRQGARSKLTSSGKGDAASAAPRSVVFAIRFVKVQLASVLLINMKVGLLMKLPSLEIDTNRVLKTELDLLHGGPPTPVGQMYAFHPEPLLGAAGARTSSDLELHQYLLRVTIEALWQMRTKHAALVGYIPDSDSLPILRLFLMSRRELPFGNFTAVVSKCPGYIESGRGHVRGHRNVPLAYWEYPCSAFSIWPPAPEGVPFLTSEVEYFQSVDLRYWMLHREYEFASRSFDDIAEALGFAVNMLIGYGHGFVVNVLGPKEAKTNHASTVQIVGQGMVFNDGQLGLTLHLPFDPLSGTFDHLVEFLDLDVSTLFTEYKLRGIPCFAACFGTNVDLASKATLYVLGKVFGYDLSTTFTCTVFDEGPLKHPVP